MRFIDEHELTVTSGHGGPGASSFRRESKVPQGGPDGGDGGRGGHVVLLADPQLTSLLDIRHRPQWKADDGVRGGKRQMTGANGENLVIRLPLGTLVFDADSDTLLLDLNTPYEERVVAEGGKGGLGNVHFKTSTNRSPRKTTPGGRGVTLRLRLELRVMADVGLLGFPNAGKSTFISVISAARPRVADYPFTTLTPSLGVVDMGIHGNSFVVADIPGIIEGAAEGKGLGHQFLRHVSRTRLLLHLLSLQGGDHGESDETESGDRRLNSPAERYRVLREELRRYDTDLVKRPEIVVLTKADIATDEQIEQAKAELTALGVQEIRVISSVARQGIHELTVEISRRLHEMKQQEQLENQP